MTRCNQSSTGSWGGAARRRCGPLWIIAAACLCTLAPHAAAQTDDPAPELIRALVSNGMPEAAQALLQNPPQEPRLAEQVRDGLAEAYLPSLRGNPDAFIRAIGDLVDYQQQMYDSPQARDHWARPKWGADLAQELIISVAPEMYLAGAFCTLGVPNEPQRRVVDLIAAEALDLCNQSENEYFDLQSTVRTREDFVSEFINTGRWDQLQQYVDLNIPYNRAWAIVYLLSQDNDGPWFADKPDKDVARQGLIRQADTDLETAMRRARSMGLPADTLARIEMLQAHMAIYRTDYDQARQLAEQAAGRGAARPYTRFLARLAVAKAMHLAGLTDAAAGLLRTLGDHPAAAANPLRPVLVADRQYLILYDRAMAAGASDQKQQLIGEAFSVYVDLLNSDAIAQQWRGAVQQFIEDRYNRQVPPGIDASEMPGPVQLAAITSTFQAGERLRQQNQTEQANARYAEVVSMAETLLDREGLGAATEAEAMFYRGYAQLRSNQAGFAAQSLIELADRFPDRQRGEQAIQVALVSILQPLYDRQPDNATVQRLLINAYQTLFEKYPTIDLAALASYDYAAFLRQSERYADAVEAYARVPEGHEAYLNAQYERLACLGVLWQEATEAASVGEYAGRIVSAARTFIAAAEPQLDRLPPDRRDTIRRFLASARLLRISVQLETFNQTDQATQELREVREKYGDLEPIQSRLQSATIRVLQKQGKFDEAEAQLRQYMQREPEKAGQLALQVLQSINQQIKAMDKDDPQVAVLAEVASNLARSIILPWARQQDFSVEQMIAYELMPARSLMAAGRWEPALQQFQGLIEQHGEAARNKIEVVEGMAECHFQLGTFAEASMRFNKLIAFLQQQGDYNNTYWNAQTRATQIMDRAAERDNKIPNTRIFRRVRQLANRQPDLGGEPYAAELLRLQNKHAPR